MAHRRTAGGSPGATVGTHSDGQISSMSRPPES